jgi:hypothetical protein
MNPAEASRFQPDPRFGMSTSEPTSKFFLSP